MSTPTRTEAARPTRTEGSKSTKAPGQGAGPKTVGPIPDLERHLPTEWWRTLFNSIYLKTDGDVVENQRNTARDVDQLVRAAGLELNDRVLDLCCGQGRHCLELARRGFKQVTGLDRSRYLIRLAKKRAKQEGLTISFHEGDARRFRFPEESFNCVALMGNSFGYFDREEDDLSVLRAALRVLRPAATLAMDLADGAWTRTHFERRSWEWIDQMHFVCRERSLAADGVRLISREVVVHAEKGVIADQFYAERLYSKDDITTMLDRVGFKNVRVHDPIVTESDRNQDLGMLAHRMFISAEAPRRSPVVTKKGPAFPLVTVLMGDPRLPDAVKRDGQFNPEDLATIERLRDALNELAGFEFRYIDTHAGLITELRTNPPKFILNLCDEGYNNDAFMELHVPAMLEMLGIPYSGAGPTCLGLCYNKALVRAIAAALDIPVPLETYFDAADQAATIPSAFPALVKPNFGDSSIGIRKEAVVQSPVQLMTYLEQLRHEMPGKPVLIQEFLSGPEYSVGVIGNPGLTYRVLPVLQVDYSGLDPALPPILGYESKWLPDSPYWTQIRYHTAKLDEDTRRKLIDYSNRLFERLECRDYARFDFRTDAEGEIKLLEVNPNPGWCWDGKLNFMATYAGMRYAELLQGIIEAAQERITASRRNGKHG